MPRKLEVFVATKGHAFCRDAFEGMLRAIGVEPTMVDQPAAAMLLNPQGMARFDAVLLYDMPGMDFRADVEERPGFVEPEAAFREGFLALLREGKGVVALHHSIAGWPAWPAYGEALGGRFLYKPALQCGDSGYLPDVRYAVRTGAVDHPVLAALPERFCLTDELYACERFSDPRAVPLILRDTPVDQARFLSAMHAVRGAPAEAQAAWTPPPADTVLGWAKAALSSPLVYLQPGDSAATYENENYRLLLGNALRWVASPEARVWAAKQGAYADEGCTTDGP
ncbi:MULTISPECIES: ThuA domain-containing protein [unclassified Novosphingobium]|uniref:ThuA domain-containing protein n=1 Tax=unclassified Novosphingobium TaxID=2644732 RepID=UPI001F3A35CF|nr:MULTISPECIES: ThuA domain-containing protein [unclassified Novosphingobium]